MLNGKNTLSNRKNSIFNPRNVSEKFHVAGLGCVFDTAIISLNALRACDSSQSAKRLRSGDCNHPPSAYGWMNGGDPLTCPISRVAQVSGEGVRLVISLPLGTAAVVVVCEDLVVVNVTTGEQRAPARTAHGSGHVRVSQLGALVPYSLQSPWHEVQRTCDGYETTILDTVKHLGIIRVRQSTSIVPQSLNRLVGFGTICCSMR